MIGVVVGVGILVLFLSADLLFWLFFCRAVERMELTEDEKASGEAASASPTSSGLFRRAYQAGVSRPYRAGDQG